MQVGIRVVGLEQARARLEAAGRKVEPVLRGALNTTATKGRSERYVKPLGKSIAGPRVRKALRIKRANSRRLESRIIPSSSGVLVVNYRTWGYEQLSATRARIWVRGPNGRKVAAGFVNPSSSRKLPLATRSGRERKVHAKTKLPSIRQYRYEYRVPEDALGPSTAYWFKQLTNTRTIAWVNAYLQQEFARRLRKELSK